jgi:hypothetical protein
MPAFVVIISLMISTGIRTRGLICAVGLSVIAPALVQSHPVNASPSVSASPQETVPKDFPRELPVPKGKVVSTSSQTAPDKKTWAVNTEVGDLDKAIKELKAAYKAKGFAIEKELNTKTTRIFVAKKGNDTATAIGTIGKPNMVSLAIFRATKKK